MKTRVSLWDKGGEQAFDLACGIAGFLPYMLAHAALGYSLRNSAYRPRFWQPRVGIGEGDVYDRTVYVHKMRTRGKDHKELNEVANFFRATGIDELAQSVNLLEGTMHLGGPRLLVATSDDPHATTYEQMMDHLSPYPDLQAAWDGMRRVRLGAILGTYSLHSKGKTIWTPPEPSPNRFVLQAQMELHDYHENRSLRGNLRFIEAYGQFLGERLGVLPRPSVEDPIAEPLALAA